MAFDVDFAAVIELADPSYSSPCLFLNSSAKSKQRRQLNEAKHSYCIRPLHDFMQCPWFLRSGWRFLVSKCNHDLVYLRPCRTCLVSRVGL